MKKFIGLAALALATANVTAQTITTTEVEAAQRGWGEGIVKIGKEKDPRKAAVKHID